MRGMTVIIGVVLGVLVPIFGIEYPRTQSKGDIDVAQAATSGSSVMESRNAPSPNWPPFALVNDSVAFGFTPCLHCELQYQRCNDRCYDQPTNIEYLDCHNRCIDNWAHCFAWCLS